MLKRIVIATSLFLPLFAAADSFGNEAADADVIKMSMHYISQFNAVNALLAVTAFLVGFYFIYKCVFGLPGLADRGNQNVTLYGQLLYGLAGTILMFVATSQLVVYESVFGSFGGEFVSPFNYSTLDSVSFGDGAEEAQAMMLKSFFQMIGAIAFVYGASLLPALDRSHKDYQDTSGGKVLTFMISGILSMAPDKTLELLIEVIPYLKVFTGN